MRKNVKSRLVLLLVLSGWHAACSTVEQQNREQEVNSEGWLKFVQCVAERAEPKQGVVAVQENCNDSKEPRTESDLEEERQFFLRCKMGACRPAKIKETCLPSRASERALLVDATQSPSIHLLPCTRGSL